MCVSIKTIYQTAITIQDYQLTLYKTDHGLALITTTMDQPDNFAENWLTKTFENYQLVQAQDLFELEQAQFETYFDGDSTAFDFPIDLYGTSFQKTVWRQLQQVPYGETWSYSELASSINRPEAVRAVSRAIGQNPLLIVVPCHRVIGKNKKLTGFRSGLALKQTLINLETKQDK